MNRILSPIDAKIIIAKEANNSNLTNVELRYIPIIQVIRINALISFLINSFFEKTNQIPIKVKIRKTDNNWKFKARSTVVCSATESVKASVDLRNGLVAFRYLNAGNPTILELSITTVVTTSPPKNIEIFLS